MPQENTPTAYASIIKEAPIPKFVYTPFLREFISAHHTNSLLDINCKEGHFCRLSKDLGVSTVVGIDASEANIAYAKEHQQNNYASINFHTNDANTLTLNQQFSLVLALWVSCSYTSKEQLQGLMKTLFLHTQQGGKSLLLMCDAKRMTDLKTRTHFSHHIDFHSNPVTEGSSYNIRIEANGQHVAFTDYFWQPETIVSLLRAAGFSDATINYLNVSDEGIKTLGKSYWQSYEKSPFIVAVVASV